MRPTPDDLARLATKYTALADLRRAKARGEDEPPRAVFRELARAFPGALNELDTLPLELLDARAAALHEAATGGAVLSWMGWMHGYHALFRAALRVKLRLARARDVDPDRALALARDATDQAGVVIDEAFVHAVGRPPRGRLGDVVFARLAVAHGEDVDVMKDALFPARRARR